MIFSDQYMTNSAAACLQQIKHSNSKLIICDSWANFKDRYLCNEQEYLRIGITAAVIFGEFGEPRRGLKTKLKVYNWTQFLKIGEDIDNRIILKRMIRQKPGTCCNLLYTSGTTADSKGVMLSHDNMSWFWEVKNRLEFEQSNSQGEKESISLLQNFQDEVHQVSFLPLSHITAQMFDFARLICNKRSILVTFAPHTAL